MPTPLTRLSCLLVLSFAAAACTAPAEPVAENAAASPPAPAERREPTEQPAANVPPQGFIVAIEDDTVTIDMVAVDDDDPSELVVTDRRTFAIDEQTRVGVMRVTNEAERLGRTVREFSAEPADRDVLKIDEHATIAIDDDDHTLTHISITPRHLLAQD